MLWRLCLDVMEVVSRCYGGCVEMLWRLCLDVMEVVSRCYGGCVDISHKSVFISSPFRFCLPVFFNNIWQLLQEIWIF